MAKAFCWVNLFYYIHFFEFLFWVRERKKIKRKRAPIKQRSLEEKDNSREKKIIRDYAYITGETWLNADIFF